MTMVHKAELPRRSTARLSLRRLELPVEMGTGGVPQSEGEAGLRGEAVGVVTCGAQQ